MRRVLPLLIVACLGFAPAPVYRGRSADLQAMQGARYTIGGSLIREAGSVPLMVISGNRLKYSVAGRPLNEWDFELDEGTKPKRFDRKRIDSKGKSITLPGIYRIDGDTLTISSRDPERPVDFDGAGQGIFLEVFKRGKP
jgi:uncharacterized protein (TIGR03067 family)